MASPRETNLTNLEPNAPYFPRRLASGSATLSKHDGDVAAGDDGDWGVGTTLVDARPLAGEDISLIGATAVDNLPATLLSTQTAVSGPTTAVGTFTSKFVPNGPSNAIYMNFTIDDTQLAANGSVTVNGTFDMWYIDLGNVGS